VKLLLDRAQYEKDSTVGDLYIDGVWECVVMEPGVSEATYPAIPEGEYEILLTPSPRFKQVLPLIINVPGRDGIRIHIGNEPTQTEGCLLPGESVTTEQGKPFLIHSKAAFDRLMPKLVDAKARGERIRVEVIE
jgi:hypothetical protein